LGERLIAARPVQDDNECDRQCDRTNAESRQTGD
jgi:hypothetical protein